MGRREKTKAKNANGVKILIIILVLLLIVAGVLFALKALKKGQVEQVNNREVQQEEKEQPKLKIVNQNSKSRPYAVMINNNHAAWPQCGIGDAYIVYEIVAEGGITRMMALYKDQDTAKIGSIRSARHYFIDYAEENDAIFVHWGGSPQAYARLNSIDSIDGIALEGSVFFRDKTLKRDLEHTGFTSMKNVKEYADKKGYTRDTKKDLLLNYSIEDIDMSNIPNVQTADSVSIKYSDYHTTSYKYDEDKKVYYRSMAGKPNVDLQTGEQYTAKNIIVYAVNNYTLSDGENKGRQDIKNIGTGKGYYISEGKAIPITWEKKSHSEQTVYKYESGEELKVNDGNTFIQIYPTTGSVTIKANETTQNAV